MQKEEIGRKPGDQTGGDQKERTPSRNYQVVTPQRRRKKENPGIKPTKAVKILQVKGRIGFFKKK